MPPARTSSAPDRSPRRPRSRRGSAASPPDASSQAPRARDATLALDALRRVVRELRVAAKRAEEETGLSAAQLFVLQQVAAAPGLSLSEIAARTMTDRTSVGGVVERLLARSLVSRRAGAEDRRRVEIFPTAAGARLLGRAPHPPTRRVLDAMETLPDRDLRRLALALGALARAMGLAGEPAPMLFEDVAAASRTRSRGASGARAAPRPRERERVGARDGG